MSKESPSIFENDTFKSLTLCDYYSYLISSKKKKISYYIINLVSKFFFIDYSGGEFNLKNTIFRFSRSCYKAKGGPRNFCLGVKLWH